MTSAAIDRMADDTSYDVPSVALHAPPIYAPCVETERPMSCPATRAHQVAILRRKLQALDREVVLRPRHLRQLLDAELHLPVCVNPQRGQRTTTHRISAIKIAS